MLNFVFIILSILEVIGIYFAVIKINAINEKILILNQKVKEQQKIIKTYIEKTRKILQTIRKILSIITDERITKVRKIIEITSTFVIILDIYKTIKKMKGENFKNLKKVLFSKLIVKFAKLLFKYKVLFS